MSESPDVCDVPASTPDTFYDVIRFWAARMPDAPAFLSETGDAWTYSALVAAIDRIGTSLNAAGFGRKDRIAIIHSGGAVLAAAILGVWSHATAIPLSPDLRLGELAVYFRDLRVDAIAITSGLENPARIVAERLGLPVLELKLTSSPGSCAIQLLGPQTQRSPHRWTG